MLKTEKCQIVVDIDTAARRHAKGINAVPWMHTPLFSHINHVLGDNVANLAISEDFVDFRALFASADSFSEAGSVALQTLIMPYTLPGTVPGIDSACC